MPTVRSKHPCGRVGVQVEDDAERDHLALGARQGAEGLPSTGPYSSGSSKSRRGPARRHALPGGAGARAEVVERRSARQLAEPRLRAASPGSNCCQRLSARSNVSEVRSSAVEDSRSRTGGSGRRRRVFLGGGGEAEVERSLTHSVYATGTLAVTPNWHTSGADPCPTRHRFIVSVGWVDLSALTRGRAIAGALLLIAALFLAGRFLADAGSATEARPAAGAIAGDLRAEPRPRLVVHVVGAVGRPGLYRLADGARIADALRRAGGATRRADLSLVNLAAPVSDGSQVVVPKRAPPVSAGSGTVEDNLLRRAGPPQHGDCRAARRAPRCGPVTAQKIVDYREQHGAFSSVDDLDAIQGSGPRDSSSFASWWRREGPVLRALRAACSGGCALPRPRRIARAAHSGDLDAPGRGLVCDRLRPDVGRSPPHRSACVGAGPQRALVGRGSARRP